MKVAHFYSSQCILLFAVRSPVTVVCSLLWCPERLSPKWPIMCRAGFKTVLAHLLLPIVYIHVRFYRAL